VGAKDGAAAVPLSEGNEASGKGCGESECFHSIEEAGEPTRGTPWREEEHRVMELLGGKTTGTPISATVPTRLRRIADLAREAPERVFLSLAHHIDLELLREAFRRTRKDGATGVDGQTGAAYEERLEENLQSLLDRFKSGGYQAPWVGNHPGPPGRSTMHRPIRPRRGPRS